MNIYRIDEIPMERGDQSKKKRKNAESCLCETVVLIKIVKLYTDYPGRTTLFCEKKNNMFAPVFSFFLPFFLSTKLCAIPTFCDQLKLAFQMKCSAAVSSH